MSLSATDGALLDTLRGVRWPAQKRAPAGLAGEHLSPVLGGTAEFTEHRAYRQGDDPGRIDWKLLARSDRVFIRLSRERNVLPTTLLVDTSASLGYPAATLEKWHHARLIAIGLAAAAHRSGDPVGLAIATVDDGPQRLPPRMRRGAVHDIARVLGGLVPEGSPSLAPLLGPFLAASRALGRVVIVSDFLGDDAEALVAGSARLCAAGREVYAVHIIHEAELDPPHRATRVQDPERTEIRRPLTDDARQSYDEAFGAWREEIARAWRDAGARYAEVVTTEPAAYAVRRIVAPAAGSTR